MIKFKRYILLLRFVLVWYFTSSSIESLNFLFFHKKEKLIEAFNFGQIIDIIIVVLFLVTSYQLLKKIFTECIDIKITTDYILIKHFFTRKTKKYYKDAIAGYGMENYYWNFIKVYKINSYFKYRDRKLVIYSNFRPIIHLKKLNYKHFTKLLIVLNNNDFKKVRKTSSFFEKH